MKVEERRRLTDLYARGETVDLAPEGQKPFMAWVRKMTPADAEIGYLKASARRASIMAMEKEDPPSDLYLTLKGETDALNRQSLILWVAAGEMAERRFLIEAEVAGGEEWSKDRYLISLQERLSDEDFVQKIEVNSEDPEVIRIIAEIERYEAMVVAEVAEVEKTVMADLEDLPDDELRKRVLTSMITAHADAAWLAEFQRCQIWLCTYEGDDHSKRLFNSRTEVDEYQAELTNILKETIDRIHVGDAEGKDSEQTPDSSQPSE